MKQLMITSFFLLAFSYQVPACTCFTETVEKNYEASSLVIWGKVISVELIPLKTLVVENQDYATNFFARLYKQAKDFFSSVSEEKNNIPFESYIDPKDRHDPTIFWTSPAPIYGGELKVKVWVLEKYKGDINSRLVTIYTDASSSSCGYAGFHVNADFIIYAGNAPSRESLPAFYTGLCSGNKRTDEEEIEALRKLAGYEAPQEDLPFPFTPSRIKEDCQ